MRKEKREEADRKLAERKVFKDLLRFQGMLKSFETEQIREDFKAGRNGAVRLSQEELDQLDELLKITTPTRDDKKYVLSNAF